MEKRSIFRTAAGMAIVCLITVCGCNHKEASNDTPFFETLSVSSHVHLTADTLSPACDMNINLTYANRDDSIAEAINREIVNAAFKYEGLSPETAVDSFMSQYTNEYTTELLPYYNEDKESRTAGMDWYDYYYNLDSKAEKGKEGIWNYTIVVSSYEGGAHGNTTCTYLNFYEENGKVVTLDELFFPGYESGLSDILLEALMGKVEVSSLEELQDKGYLMWTSMYPSKNFLLKEDSIVFLYNAYEIAPYILGVTELTIPYKELSNLLMKK